MKEQCEFCRCRECANYVQGKAKGEWWCDCDGFKLPGNGDPNARIQCQSFRLAEVPPPLFAVQGTLF